MSSNFINPAAIAEARLKNMEDPLKQLQAKIDDLEAKLKSQKVKES